MRKNVDKIVFILSTAVIFSAVFFTYGIYSTQSNNHLYRMVNGIMVDVRLVFHDLINEASVKPIHFLQPSQHQGSGVTRNTNRDNGLILMSGFFEDSNALRLIDRDGSLRREWRINFTQLFSDTRGLPQVPTSDWNIDVHGALINPDGSVVFNLEYVAAIKLSRCGELQWSVPGGHHSVEKSERGGYWIPGRRKIGIDDGNPYPPLTFAPSSAHQRGPFAFEDDLILKVSEQGNIEVEKSVVEILYQNGLEALLTATGYNYDGGNLKSELVHMNKIAELPQAYADRFPAFEANDLVVSIRQYNLLFVVDPDTWKVKWYKTGPWLRQHDPEFAADGSIILFNNNAYRNSLGELSRQLPNASKTTNIMKIDPLTNQITRLYGSVEGQQLLSVLRGKVDLESDGHLLITEFEAGRVLEVDSAGNTTWEYINRYDDDFVLEVTEGRHYPRDYFKVEDWSCPGST